MCEFGAAADFEGFSFLLSERIHPLVDVRFQTNVPLPNESVSTRRIAQMTSELWVNDFSVLRCMVSY